MLVLKSPQQVVNYFGPHLAGLWQLDACLQWLDRQQAADPKHAACRAPGSLLRCHILRAQHGCRMQKQQQQQTQQQVAEPYTTDRCTNCRTDAVQVQLKHSCIQQQMGQTHGLRRCASTVHTHASRGLLPGTWVPLSGGFTSQVVVLEHRLYCMSTCVVPDDASDPPVLACSSAAASFSSPGCT